MSGKTPRSHYVAYARRFQILDEYERSEVRNTPISLKLEQLAALMASARRFPQVESSAAEDAEIRERFNRLREALRG